MKLLYDRLAVKRIPMPEKSSGGIIIPEELRGISQSGKVVVMGPCEKDQHGKKVRKEIFEGDTVLFPKDVGAENNIDEENLLFMRQSDVLAVVY